MSNQREYKIIIGSKRFFDNKVKELESELEKSFREYTIDTFLELVRISDDLRKRGQDYLHEKASIMILKNDNYHGIVESAHDRLGALIEDLTENDAQIIVHNPPIVLESYLISLDKRELIVLSYEVEKYDIKRQPELFNKNINDISKAIYGQDEAIKEISKSLWYLTTVNRKKPYVIMLHGESSLGKSELVREIAAKFFEGKYVEKHLSMFKNENYSNYFFGDRPNRRSLGFDLLERESNLVFLDEFDKCPEFFFSAFYTLFDNTSFSDSTYKLDVSGLLIILTSNYRNIDEMKKHLGLPIFYRINKFIHFEQFTIETILSITMNEIKSHCVECNGKLDTNEVYDRVSVLINSKGENARTIKNKVQNIVEEMLFEEISMIEIV